MIGAMFTFVLLCSVLFVVQLRSESINIIGKDCKLTDPIYKNTFDLTPLHTTFNYTQVLSKTDYVNFNICGDIIPKCNNLTHAAACVSKNGSEHVMGIQSEPILADGRIYFNYTGDKCATNPLKMYNLQIIFICDYSNPILEPITSNEYSDDDCSLQIFMRTPHVCLPLPKEIQSNNCSVTDDKNHNFNLMALSQYNNRSFVINVCKSVLYGHNDMCPPGSSICLQNNNESNLSKKFVNYGSTVSNPTYENGKLFMHFTSTECNKTHYISSHINFNCDTSIEIGRPEYLGERGYEHRFVWNTELACSSSVEPCIATDTNTGFKKYKLNEKNNGSTGNLYRHTRKVHTDKIEQQKQEKENDFVYSPEKYRAALVKWIVSCNQPFSEVKQNEFLEMVKTLNPHAETISDSTVKRDVMKTYLKRADELKRHLKKIPGKISFTADGWTSKSVLPFMAIRGHWINSDWKYETVLLDFTYIEGDHSGSSLCDLFLKCLKFFDIPLTKVLVVTMDNVGSNDTFMTAIQSYGIEVGVNYTPDEHRVRCLAHILNLTVQDVMNNLKLVPVEDSSEDDCVEIADDDLFALNIEDEVDDEITDDFDGPTIEKIRKLVKKIRKSPQKRQKLKKLCDLYKIGYLTPILDVATRWNSTFHMIERADKLKTPLRALCSSEKSLNGFVMAEFEWTELNTLKKLLSKFDRATKLVSMERHPTICAYIPTLNWLLDSLKQFIAENPGSLGAAAEFGLEKLEKYEDLLQISTSKVPFVAVFLNPALKMNYFKEHVYHKNQIKEIQKTICALFEKNYTDEPSNNDDDKDESEDEFFSHMYKRTVNRQPKEFQKYLQHPLSSAKVDILEFWRSQETEFPGLYRMARDYLSVQSGSVAVERDFNQSSDVVTNKRNGLRPDTVQACMCLKNWYKFDWSS